MSTFKKLVQKQKDNQQTRAKGINLEATVIGDKGRVVACPCSPSKRYKDCCEPIHNNINLATTPELLMRSGTVHLYWLILII